MDFEDSASPVLTERRQSCYYESTYMLRTMASDKITVKNQHLQQLYNMHLDDTRNMSMLISEKPTEPLQQFKRDDEAEKHATARKSATPASNNANGKQPQDSSNKSEVGQGMAQLDLFPPGKTEQAKQTEEDAEESVNEQIEGLSNFSFSDIPQDEVELRVHFNKFIEQMQLNDHLL